MPMWNRTAMKLLVRNLARTTTESELQSLFEPFGTIQSCNLIMDKVSGTSKGFGFIEMPKSGEAKAAVKTLNGQEIAGSKIRVKKAEEKPTEEKATNESVWATTKTQNQDQTQSNNQPQSQPASNPWGRSDNNTEK